MLVAFLTIERIAVHVIRPVRSYIVWCHFRQQVTSMMIILSIASNLCTCLFFERWFTEIIELNRCLFYFAFDRYLISSVQWPLRSTQQMLLVSSLCLIRIVHLTSIIFWIFHYFLRTYQPKTFFVSKILQICKSEPVAGDRNDDRIVCKNRLTIELANNGLNNYVEIRSSNLLSITLLASLSAAIYIILYLFTVPSCSTLFDSSK